MELLISCLLVMFLLISSEVTMAARTFEKGEVVKETNEVGNNAQLVGGVNIPGIIGNIPGIVGSIPGTIGSIPGGVGGIPPRYGGFLGGGYAGQGGYGGGPYCPYSCCVWALGGVCSSCCTI
ncbi:hypothetical protein GYH30_005298 [Glycine max]|uniref:Glycine-rich protein n=2 Tax=Glycine subgen. Soja TaxID=1462606 RepID=A0A0R0L9F0_SOYBN|nr:hypothetical protein JHK87_005331 [Glycine soja]KAH1062224.1 hypothetical protein GYH30_005298 [Glycine max]